MHIVVNGRFLTQATTGVQRYAREIVAAFDQHVSSWPDTTIEMLVPTGTRDLPVYRNIRVRPVGRLTGHFWEQFELPFYARGSLLFCPGNTAPLISLLRKTKDVVVTVHDLSYKYFPAAYSRSFRLLYSTIMPVVLRLATRVITVSNAEKAQMLRFYPFAERRISVVPNGGMPPQDLANVARSDEQKRYALYVGSFSKRKNFDAVLKVASRLLAARPELEFVFIGDQSKIFEAIEIQQDPSVSRMKFLGQIDCTQTLARYYRHASVFVFPSFYESSGLPPIEAMACGCPVVVSNIPALTERCGDAAVYCDPNDVDGILQAVLQIVDDARLAEDLRRAGLERAREFTWDLCATRTMAIMWAISEHKKYNDYALSEGMAGDHP